MTHYGPIKFWRVLLRNSRLKRYKKYRHKKLFKLILFGVIIPSFSLLVAYIVIAVLVLPTILK